MILGEGSSRPIGDVGGQTLFAHKNVVGVSGEVQDSYEKLHFQLVLLQIFKRIPSGNLLRKAGICAAQQDRKCSGWSYWKGYG